MSEVKELQGISMKKTKDVIYDALQKALKLLQEKNNVQLNPVEEVQVKKAKETIAVAETVIADVSLVEMIHNLRTEGTITLEQVASKIEEATKGYEAVLKATDLRKKELTDMFGVEEALLNLATVVNTNEALKTKYEAEFETIRVEKEELVKAVRVRIEEENAASEVKILDLEAAAKKERERKEAEWKYEFDRQKIKDADDLKDELAEERKLFEAGCADTTAEHDEREKEISAREDAMTDKEADFNKYKKIADDLPKTIAIAVDKAVEKAIKDTEALADTKAEYEKKAFVAEKSILENEIKMLKAEAEKKDASIIDLTGKLDKAYEKIQDVANNVANASRPTYVNTPTGK